MRPFRTSFLYFLAPFLFAFLLWSALPARAQGESFPWRPLQRAEGLPSDDVFDLCSSGADRLWIATAAGLCRIEEHEILLIGPAGTPRLLAAAPESGVYALYPTDAKGIAWVREGSVEWLELPVEPARQSVEEMRSEADGTLWIVSNGEVFVRRPGATFTRDAGRSDLHHLPRTEPDIADAPVPIHRALLHRGEIWGATRGKGIWRRRLEPRFRRVTLPASSRVHALSAAPDGSIWCGTEQGLARIRDGRVESIPQIEGKTLGVVTGCAVDREGRVWVGSGSSFTGVYRLDGAGWHHLSTIPAYVHRITTDPTGAVWFAVLNKADGNPDDGQGAWYFSDGEFHRAPLADDFPSGRVYDVVARDPSGTLWFATLKGLAALEGNQRITRYTPESGGLPGEKVWCLAAARDGSLWIGYQAERGVSRLVQGQVTHFDVEDGLCDGNVWSIVEGRPGVLWFATQSGLSRYDGRRWSCFRAEEGLGLAPIWPLLPLPDGSLWIGTIGEGAVHYVPGDRAAPRTTFERAAYEADENAALTVAWSGVDAWFDTPRADLWYRWRLDEGTWSKASPSTSVSLRPSPGTHRLEVQAIDRVGNAEDPPRTVTITVAAPGPSWTLYAGIAAVLLVAGFLIGRRAARTDSAAQAT